MSCAEDTAGEPLPADDYEVQAILKFILADDDRAVLVATAPFTINTNGGIVVDEAYLNFSSSNPD